MSAPRGNEVGTLVLTGSIVNSMYLKIDNILLNMSLSNICLPRAGALL